MRVLLDFTARMGGNPGGRNYALYMLPLWEQSCSDELTALFMRGSVPSPLRALASVQEVDVGLNHAPTQRLLNLHFSVPRVAKRGGFDVVYCPGNVSPATLPPGLPLVVAIRSTLHWHYDFNFAKIRRTYLRLSDRHSVRRASRVIVPSSSVADDLMRFAAADRDKLVVVPHGVDLERFRPRAAVRDPRLFLFVSAPWDYKGLATSMRALKALSEDWGPHRQPRLVIAAGGVPRERVRAVHDLIAQIGVGRFVDFRTELAHEELAELYAEACALVLPSSQESFGNAYLEAAASGCPIIVGAGCVSEAIRPVAIDVPTHSHTALATAMSVVGDLTNKERNQRSDLLRAWAEQFPWTRTLSQTRRVLAEVV